MPKDTISFIQPNFQTGPKHLNSFYLPYSLGTLWSYALQNDEIKNNFTEGEWIFKRENLDGIVHSVKDSNIVLLSLYIWNKNFCFELAKKLKAISPNISIVAGGPELPHKEKNFFDKYPFLDSIVIGEGELSFELFLLDYLKGDTKKIYSLPRIEDLNIPSPYLTGVFDKLIQKHPDIEWVPTLETDRGCPYKCTFCDWGSLTASKMYKFCEKRIKDELEWFGKNNLPYLSMTNSNFGIFKERDLKIADWILESKAKYNVPTGLSVSYAKNSNDTVIKLVKKFNDANIQSGVSVSLQSNTLEVLENIKRTNLRVNKIDEIVKLSRENNLPVMTELILGLPGETFESFTETIDEVLKQGILYLDIFLLQILVNAPMAGDDEKKYELDTFQAYDYFYETTNNQLQEEIANNYAEAINVVYSTSTLKGDKFTQAMIYSWFITGFHSYGLTNLIADYLYKEHTITHSEFYTKLLSYMSQDKYIAEWTLQFRETLEDWKKRGYVDSSIGNTKVLGHAILTNLMPAIQSNNLVEYFIEDICNHLSEEYNLSGNVIDDYRALTNLQVKQFGKYIKQPIKYSPKSNLVTNKEIEVVDRFESYPEKIEQHIDYLFFGRRRMWYLNKFNFS
jgi:radical SAM superfamily enzyme YgiQ (UPF0313 family)